MTINNDLFSHAGPVRIRASAADPFSIAGSEGYFKARGFDKKSPTAAHAAAAEQIKFEAVHNLIKAINAGRLAKPTFGPIVFESGASNFANDKGNRRFWVVRK